VSGRMKPPGFPGMPGHLQFVSSATIIWVGGITAKILS